MFQILAMFPGLDEQVVLEILDSSKYIDQAVNILLSLSSTPPQSMECIENPVSTVYIDRIDRLDNPPPLYEEVTEGNMAVNPPCAK